MLGSAAVNGVTLLLVGLWATLQFKWIRERDRHLTISVERLLFATTLPVGMVVLSLGTSSAVGINLAPFVAMVIGCVLYSTLMRPTPSSFQVTSRGPGFSGNRNWIQIQGQFEGVVSALEICLFPALLYLATHWEVVFESEHFWSVHMLWSLPAVFLCFVPDGLWWITEEVIRREYVRAGLATVCGIIALASFEGRIVFFSFGTYIPLHAPWSWIVVSMFLFSNAAVIGAHFAGFLSSQIGFTVGAGVLITAACAGGIATGLPLALMPAPLIGSAGFALFYDSGLLRDYLIFVAGTATTVFWLIWHHFWFLEITIGAFSLQQICQLICICFIAALVVPGLALADFQDRLVRIGFQIFLLIQAGCLTVLEESLYGGEQDEGVVIYPAYLVLGTSGLGVFLARSLEEKQKVSKTVSWFLQCCFLSKLPVLILPQENLVFPVFCLIAAITVPLLLKKSNPVEELPTWKGVMLTGTVISAVLLARMVIFDLVQSVLDSRPPESFLLGLLLISISTGCLPLLLKFYPSNPGPRRALILTGALGGLLCVLRPPLPVQGMAKCVPLPAGLCPRLWDERHVPFHEVEDVEMYGLGLSRREHWPLWLLIGSVFTGLAAAVTNNSPVNYSRMLFGAIGGLSVGSYLSLEFFPDQGVLQIVILVSCVLSCVFLVVLQRPGGLDLALMVLLMGSWFLLFPLSLILQASIPLPGLPEDFKRLFPDNPVLITRERERAAQAAIFAIYACQSLLLSFAIKLKISRTLNSGNAVLTGRSWDPRSQGFGGSLPSSSPPMMAFCSPGGLNAMFSAMVAPRTLDRWAKMMKMSGPGGMMFQRLSSAGLGWLPTTGNLISVFCFLVSLSWSSYFSQGKELVVFLLAPILLLLNQDPVFCRDLSEKRRYFPVVLSLVLMLFWEASVEIFTNTVLNPGFSSLDDSIGWFLLRNCVSLGILVPSIGAFLHYLWIRKQVTSHGYAIYLLPLNIVPFFKETLLSIRLLGLIGICGCGVIVALNANLSKVGRSLC